ncbi:hypothetical protein DITRI_Ditri13aG0112900 [Diplodiscus trichospermus]
MVVIKTHFQLWGITAAVWDVDGSSLGKPGPAGIGGILRDHLGNELIRFSRSVGMSESNVAELLAIREAFVLYVSSSWARCHDLLIESDSLTAVNWANNPLSVPWSVKNIANHIENLKLQIKSWKIGHIYRESNQVADELAKEGFLDSLIS